jgi:hypothetical protein
VRSAQAPPRSSRAPISRAVTSASTRLSCSSARLKIVRGRGKRCSLHHPPPRGIVVVGWLPWHCGSGDGSDRTGDQVRKLVPSAVLRTNKMMDGKLRRPSVRFGH